MNIAYLSTFYPYRGGIAQFNARLYRELQKQANVTAYNFKRQYPNLLFPGTSQYVTSEDVADSIHTIRILDSINPFSYYRTARTILKSKPDLLLTKFWMPFFGPSLGKVANLVKKKGVVPISILDNVIPHEKRFFDPAFTRYFLKQNKAFVVMSQTVRNELLELHPKANFILQPHPLYDHFGEKILTQDARKKLSIPLDKNVVLFFGIIRHYKGLDLLIEAAQYFKEDTVLLIAGESYGEFEKYKKRIEELNLSNKMHLFVRYIPDQEVNLFFSAADVCVLPYRSATQSGIIPICYHFDLPVIATSVGGLKEVIEEDKTGKVLTSSDPIYIAETIHSYFLNQSKQKFLPFIIEYKKRLGWENFAARVVDLYHSVK